MSSRPSEAPSLPVWPPTGWLALVGSTVFASGFFLLAAAGQDFGAPVYAVILCAAVLVSAPILALAVLVAGSEAVVGHAWASGFRALPAVERGRRGIAERGLRYAGFLWLANGCALWFATLAAQV